MSHQHDHNHDHNHTHGHSHNHFGSAAGQHIGRLYAVLALTGSYLVVQVVVGILTNSLALLADAGHMLTDVLGLGMAIFAIKLGQKASHNEKTFGYYRTEILAALANAVILVVVAFYILYEAVQRFTNPAVVSGWGVLVVGGIGLLVNLIGLLILRQGAQDSLNLRGAYLEVMSDTLGSLGAVLAAVIILLSGWYPADAIIGVAIGLFIVPRAFNLLKESVNVLLEGTPASIDLDKVRTALLTELPCVIAVHDLHVWTITSGMHAMSGHIVVSEINRCNDILGQAQKILHDRFAIEHCTLQLETPEFDEAMQVHS